MVHSFCAELRCTFRRLGDEQTNIAVMRRHAEFYHVGRALYEAGDHFGSILGAKKKVLHGLNTPLKFKAFSEYFNAPTSTTIDMNAGMHMHCLFRAMI